MSVTVLKQVKMRMSQRKPLEIKDVPALKLLSVAVMENLRFELFKGPLRGHQIFRLMDRSDSEVLKRICNKGISFRSCLADDVLFVQETVCNEAYFVMNGVIDYTQRPLRSTVRSATQPEPKRATQGEWLSWAAMWSHWFHVGQAQMLQTSEVLTVDVVVMMKCVDTCGDLTNFFQQYSLAFHRRLVSAVPPAAVWPTDLSVPFTDFGEIVLSLGPREQKFVGTKALQNLEQRSFAWKGMSMHAIQQLQQEVSSGRCVIIENVDGNVERVVPITGIRLSRFDGKVLIVFAKKHVEDDDMEVSGQLPAVKQQAGELPGQALQRLLRELLQPFAKEVLIKRMGREDKHEISARFRINTTYIRVIYTATLTQASTLSCSPVPLSEHGKTLNGRPQWHTQSVRWSLPSHDECFLLRDSHSVFVCGWVDPEAVNVVHKMSKQLREWIGKIDTAIL